jgi:outer membrane protein TolC
MILPLVHSLNRLAPREHSLSLLWVFHVLLCFFGIVGVAQESKPVLHFETVLQSVTSQYPPYLAALIERDIAQGHLRSTKGAFDFETFAKVFQNPTGFYESTTVEAGFEQFTGIWGSTVFGSYRWTDGLLPDYYSERRTDRSGTPSLGFKLPLLRDGSIDKRRAAIAKAKLEVELVNPVIQRQRLDFVKASASAYLNWMKAGKNLQIAEQMLELATLRTNAIQTRIDKGLSAPVVSLENRQMVVSRQMSLIKARRAFESASITLSLFLRDIDDAPVKPVREQLPQTWPELVTVPEDILSTAWKYASVHRPEIRYYNLEMLKLGVDSELFQNQLNPRLDAYVAASQSQGQSLYKDTGEFELKLGFEFRMPLERNAAKGAVQANEANIEQLERSIGFAIEKIFTEIEDSYSALRAAKDHMTLAVENKNLASNLRGIEADRFRWGATNLLSLQIREQTAFKANQSLIDARYNYYKALTGFLIASAVDFRESDEVSPVLWTLASGLMISSQPNLLPQN